MSLVLFLIVQIIMCNHFTLQQGFQLSFWGVKTPPLREIIHNMEEYLVIKNIWRYKSTPF